MRHVVSVLVLALVLATGMARADVSSSRPDHGRTKQCPAWFGGAPRLGEGRPRALNQISDLANVLVCRYLAPPAIGSPAPADRTTNLSAQKQIRNTGVVRSLARAVDRLHPYPRVRGPRLCPLETRARFFLRFLYTGGREASIRVFSSGCSRVVAGKRGRWLILSNAFQDRLDELVSPAR